MYSASRTILLVHPSTNANHRILNHSQNTTLHTQLFPRDKCALSMDTDVDGRASTSLSSSSSSSLWLLQSDNGPNTRLFIPDGGHGLGDGGMVGWWARSAWAGVKWLNCRLQYLSTSSGIIIIIILMDIGLVESYNVCVYRRSNGYLVPMMGCASLPRINRLSSCTRPS